MRFINEIKEAIINFFKIIKKDKENKEIKDTSIKYADKTIKTCIKYTIILPIVLILFILFLVYGYNNTGMAYFFTFLIFWIFVFVIIVVIFNVYIKSFIYLHTQLSMNKTKKSWIALVSYIICFLISTTFLVLFFIFIL